MNPKKQKMKDRRRGRKLAEQAWEAAHAGNLDLAEKIVRRAVAAQPENPVLWTDQGAILALRHKEVEAAAAFWTALSLAPTFAEPYAQLATLRVRQGFIGEAVALQTQAVQYAPQNAAYAERLAAYRSLASQGEVGTAGMTAPAVILPVNSPSGDWAHRLAQCDWPAVADRLTRDGCALIPALVDAPTCEHLRELFHDDARFAKTVEMDRP
ncbi:MAG TPA: hypothetical protein VMS17_31660, partial [Gemmataceae bacterium]|nr:hypothetical protein [Gemmataceae bacterium]